MLSLFVVAISWFIFNGRVPCISGAAIQRADVSWNQREFERSYNENFKYTSCASFKLIGYTTIRVADDEFEQFEKHYVEHVTEWKNISHMYYEEGSGLMRVYFPVKGALVEHCNGVTEATHLGELQLVRGDIESLAVIGRMQSDDIRGVDHNIIKDGIIYLSEKKLPHHRFDDVFVFEFGEKIFHDHSQLDKRDDPEVGDLGPTVACMKNHGGPNCSDKFGIHMGRCPFIKTWCMDYNGWFTDCQKVFGNEADPRVGVPKLAKFAGSDCDYALGAGNCWNEFMG